MKIRVMICDDNEEFVADARAHFAASDKIELIETAANGKQALERLDTARPDVLLLDLVMPTLDGFSVLERVDKGNMKIIVVSALSQDAFISKAMTLGADFYMMKPVSFGVLDERIIEVAWNIGKIENINTLFGVRVYTHNEKPTNGEFIALVADKMLLESV